MVPTSRKKTVYGKLKNSLDHSDYQTTEDSYADLNTPDAYILLFNEFVLSIGGNHENCTVELNNKGT